MQTKKQNNYNFFAFRGRGGFHETLVQSVMETISIPDICNPLIADILPGPNPRTVTLTVL